MSEMRAGRFRIVTDRMTRDPRMERRLIEYNRDKYAYIMLLVGAVLVLLSIMW